ncbi:MAG: hypothetical protein D4S01_00835 [Dehalococcoidia bacterium]|nr:MAG: hypothetical protein D4S01_00835 [Dehalococcoidia bacterium]
MQIQESDTQRKAIRTEVPICLATMSRIISITDRLSFSQIINDLVIKYPNASTEQQSFAQPPDDHILTKWIANLKTMGWWMPWMNTYTEMTLYHLTCGTVECPVHVEDDESQISSDELKE